MSEFLRMNGEKRMIRSVIGLFAVLTSVELLETYGNFWISILISALGILMLIDVANLPVKDSLPKLNNLFSFELMQDLHFFIFIK